jgi:hypothetical protein
MDHKVESPVSLLVSETRLFATGSDCHVCGDRFINLKISEDMIDFMILILIPGLVFFCIFPNCRTAPGLALGICLMYAMDRSLLAPHFLRVLSNSLRNSDTRNCHRGESLVYFYTLATGDLLQQLVETFPECTFGTNRCPGKETDEFPLSNRFWRGRVFRKFCSRLV